MNNIFGVSYSWIQSKGLNTVKVFFFLLSIFVFTSTNIRAETAGEAENKLPDIVAAEATVKIIGRSKSLRIYMVETTEGTSPNKYRILLFKKNNEPIMAFRVLKEYPDKNRFAAKRVRYYGNNVILNNGETFRSLEKISDIDPALLVETDEDLDDIEELENLDEPAPQVSEPEEDKELELDEEPAPIKEQIAEDLTDDELDEELDEDEYVDPEELLEEAESEEEEEMLGLYIEEVEPFDYYYNNLTGSLGYYKNFDAYGAAGYYVGFGLKYGITIGKTIFLRSHDTQDSLVLEGGVSYYRILGLATGDDAYLVVPLTGTVRYNIHYSKGFGIFFYGGITQNFVKASVGDLDTYNALSSTLISAGGGIIFQIGPGWFARFDAGLDMFLAGLMLKF